MGNSGYDVTHYDISLDVDPIANTLTGVTSIHANATARLPEIFFDLAGLDVTAVTVNGERARISRMYHDLMVLPAETIHAGSSFVVVIEHSGTPAAINDPGVPFTPVGWFWTDGVVYTANEPSGAMTWFPSNNHPTDKATFEFRITVPERFTAAANGLLESDTVVDGRRTAVWQMNDPMATYLAAVYVGEFERHEQALRDDLLIRNYIPSSLPDAERQSMLDALAITPGAIEYFESLLGAYPFDAYGTIVMPQSLGFALENQTLSVHGRQMLGPRIIAHELAHQWFGNSSTAQDWSEIWLHEGFAHYLSLLYLADVDGQDLDALMANELQGATRARAAPPGDISISQLFDYNVVYRRGALTLHALHQLLGRETFTEILRRHYVQSAAGTTTTAEFEAVVAELGGAAAVGVLNAWLHNPQMPTR